MRTLRLPAFLVVFLVLFVGADSLLQDVEAASHDVRAEQCLALNVYWEARSESKLGQQAVAAVTLNRVNSQAFPNDVCEVVRQGGERRNRCQFSWWCDGKKDHPTDATAWGDAQHVARAALKGDHGDPTYGALFYHATYVQPSWARSMTKTRRIGQHIFFTDPTKLAVSTPLPNTPTRSKVRPGDTVFASLF